MKGWIYPLLAVSALILAIGLWRRHSSKKEEGDADPKLSPQKSGALTTKAKDWLTKNWSLIAIAVGGTVLVNWLWYALAPRMYKMWWNSSSFWPMTIAIIFTATIAGRKDTMAKVARWLLVGGIAVGLLIGGAGYASATFCFAGALTHEVNGKTAMCEAGDGKSADTTPPNSRKFSGNARDLDQFRGPERDSVMEYFSDIPTFADIAAAESKFTQFSDSTEQNCDGVLQSGNSNGTRDIGVMQINSIHIMEADRLGNNLCTLRGNMEFARHLYEVDRKAGRDGYTDWNASRSVWEGRLVNSTVQAGSKLGNVDTTFLAPATSSGEMTWSGWIAPGPSCGISFMGIDHEDIAVQINNDNGEVIKMEKGKTTPVPEAKRFRFGSTSVSETLVQFICIRQE